MGFFFSTIGASASFERYPPFCSCMRFSFFLGSALFVLRSIGSGYVFLYPVLLFFFSFWRVNLLGKRQIRPKKKRI